MPRKGENIRKRKDGRWEARYEKCRDQNGRIQYGYLYGRTYEAVKKKKLAILCQNNLQNSPGKCYVFRNLSEEWMLSMRYAVKLSTYACYETLLDTHILPEFGDTPLRYISSASVYTFSEKLKQQGLSPRTIKNLLILFHSILRYGEKQGYLNLSQLEFRYPKINTSPFQLISHEHLTKLITVLSAEDSEFPIGILLCIYTGIRVGDDDKIRLNQRKPSKYKGLRRFGPEKNLQRINKFMKERPIFYKNLIQMKENIRFYLRCFYCITKVMILQFNSENRTELARNG